MHGSYDKELMARGKVARLLISEGEDPYRMFAAVVWPGRDWAEDALQARLVTCPVCLDDTPGCDECAGTGLVSGARHEWLAYQADVAQGVFSISSQVNPLRYAQLMAAS